MPKATQRRTFSASEDSQQSGSARPEYDGSLYDGKIPSSPPPAALTERAYPRSIALTPDEEPMCARESRTQHRALTPLLEASSGSPQSSPERSPRHARSAGSAPLTGDHEGQTRACRSRGGISSWFSGSSSPVSLGIGRESSPARSSFDGLRAASRSTSPTKSGALRFSIFGTKPSAEPAPLPASFFDEFSEMDLSHSLDPHDTDLHGSAVSLLSRFQDAYRTQKRALGDLTSEGSAQHDELCQARTRATALLAQLEASQRTTTAQSAELTRLGALVAAAEREPRRHRRAQPSTASSSDGEDLGLSTGPPSGSEADDADSVFSHAPPRRASLVPEDGCPRCAGAGGDAGFAWDTVGLLQAENGGLTDRVLALDRAVEGALACVRGGFAD
jgi:hypothetical protein